MDETIFKHGIDAGAVWREIKRIAVGVYQDGPGPAIRWFGFFFLCALGGILLQGLHISLTSGRALPDLTAGLMPLMIALGPTLLEQIKRFGYIRMDKTNAFHLAKSAPLEAVDPPMRPAVA